MRDHYLRSSCAHFKMQGELQYFGHGELNNDRSCSVFELVSDINR